MKRDFKQLYDLTGKNAVVTGGVGILGEFFCRGLAEFGANVVVADKEADKCAAFAKQLSSEYSVKALGVACDISSADSVKAMTKQVSEAFGSIHILHNNAASKSENLEAFFAPFEEYSLTEWKKIMSVNIDGMFLVAQAIGGLMAKGSGGSIVQTSSIYGVVAPDPKIYEGSHYLGRQINTPAVYAASKAAVIGLTRYLSVYWADKKIRVNTLVPGGNESGQNDTFKKKYSARVPLGRMGNPYEMVAPFLFLASDASAYMTGQSLVVDGGLTIW